jgi:hypothetical protein
MRFGARTFGADGVPLTGNPSDRIGDDFVRDQKRRSSMGREVSAADGMSQQIAATMKTDRPGGQRTTYGTGNISGLSANNLLTEAVKPQDLGKLIDLAGSGISGKMEADQLRRSAQLGTMSQDQISGKLDQLVSAMRDAYGRPNISISNVDDAATIGKIYREGGRDSARRSGL